MDNYYVIHMVSAWANKEGIVLGQVKVDDKSNEISALPKLLDLINVSGCTITSDAMSCQKKTVEKVIDNEDKCRMRVDNSAENFAVIRHIAMNLYKSFIKQKLSLKSKRFSLPF